MRRMAPWVYRVCVHRTRQGHGQDTAGRLTKDQSAEPPDSIVLVRPRRRGCARHARQGDLLAGGSRVSGAGRAARRGRGRVHRDQHLAGGRHHRGRHLQWRGCGVVCKRAGRGEAVAGACWLRVQPDVRSSDLAAVAVNLDELADKLQDKVDTANSTALKAKSQEQLDVVTSIREIANRPESQFTSIPQAMYWAIVTMTTVGYGDVVPKTAVGKVISALLILLGYSLIIVPSTFVSAEFIQKHQRANGQAPPCEQCNATGHREDAEYCYRCGKRFAA